LSPAPAADWAEFMRGCRQKISKTRIAGANIAHVGSVHENG
jgi:hypothetical protein